MFRVRGQIACEEAFVMNEPRRRGTIAVLDTGVGKHPDFTGRILDFKDFVHNRNMIYDDSGHGTHVCGIAGGSGKLSDGKFKGISPYTNLIVGKVLDEYGNGSVEAMIAGIRWVIESRKKYDIRILNISIGIGELQNKEKETAIRMWLENAWDMGLLVVCAAGNGGPAWDTISPLGTSPRLITVGCHDGEYFKNMANRCETYSGRGSLMDTIRKPDIVAPGTEIVSCDVRCRKTLKGYTNSYVKKSGTSMATPIVSGALSLLLQKNPEINNELAKKKILYSATDLGDPWYKQGYGMVHVARLLQ